jgi:hypothetical protein
VSIIVAIVIIIRRRRIQFVIYLRAYSTAQRVIIKQEGGKGGKTYKQRQDEAT